MQVIRRFIGGAFFGVLISPVMAQKDTSDWTLYNPDERDSTIEIREEEPFTANSDSLIKFNPANALNFDTTRRGRVVEEKDDRLNEILTFLGTPNPPDPVKIDGYRVQLFFDQDRDKALGEKARFLSAFPEMKAYMEWNAPNHYVRVGNFYTQQQARQFAEEIKDRFPSVTVYKSKIELPELD